MKICVIGFDEQQNHAAIKFDLTGRKIRNLQYFAFAPDQDGSREFLSPESVELICLVGFLPHAIARDVVLPLRLNGADLRSAIAFKLEAIQPLEPNQLHWGYRVWQPERHETTTQARVYAVKSEALKQLFEHFESINVKMDAFLYLPAILSPDVFPELTIYENIDESLFSREIMPLFDAPYQKFRENLPAEATASDAISRILFIAVEYLRRRGMEKFMVECATIPPEHLKPVRYRAFRKFYALALFLILLAAGSWGTRLFLRSHQQYVELEGQCDRLLRQAAVLQKEQRRLLDRKQQMEKFMESRPGYSRLLYIIGELSDKIPDFMWVSGFNASGDDINITLISNRDDADIYTLLSDSSCFELVNLRKSKSHQNQFNYFLKLKSRLEDEL